MQINVAYDLLPKQGTARAAVVMDHFGISFEQGQHVIAEGLELPLVSGDVVLFTGPSGSGKSSLMRAAAAHLEGVLNLDALSLGEQLLVDALPGDTADALTLLAACGLGEAQLLLRTPAELSDGQRYRYRLALAIAQHPQWIVADEFAANLDRTLAQVIAFNLRKVLKRRDIGLLAATTHADIIADLRPDLHVQGRLDGPPVVTRDDVKKKQSASPTGSGSVGVPSPTGRISLGGIIARINSVSSAKSLSCGTTTDRSVSASSPHPRQPCLNGAGTSDSADSGPV